MKENIPNNSGSNNCRERAIAQKSNSFFSKILIVLLFLQGANFSFAQSSLSEVEIVAVGDILLARGVENRIEKFGSEYPFEKIKHILKNSDLAIGNLENPMSDKCERPPKNIRFQAKSEYTKILSESGLDIFSLANNHSFDCGKIGLFQTFENLNRENLNFIGAGKLETQAQAPLVKEIKGLKVAFIGFTAISPISSQANPTIISFASAENVKRVTASAHRQADVVVASFHWGTEYSSRPNEEQIKLAKIAVEAGADVVLGHHPHVLQGFQIIKSPNKKSLIAYSLGNFVFDSPKKLIKGTAESVILRFKISQKGLESAEYIPITIDDYRPMLTNEDQREEIDTRLQKLSSDLGTKILKRQILASEKLPDSQEIIETDLDSNGKIEKIDLSREREFTLQIWQEKKMMWQGVPKNWKPWKLEIADVDGDGKREIIVGIVKSTKFFPKPHNCLFIYGWDENRAYPKWLGSSLSRPFTEFSFADLDYTKGDELIALETNLDGKKSMAIYRWNSFGFTLERQFGDWQTAKILSVEKGNILIEADGERFWATKDNLRRVYETK